MKLGFLSACMPERSLEDIAAWAGANGYEALELAAWPALGDRPFTASHVAADAFDDAEAERVRAALEGNGLVLSALAYYDNNLHPDPSEREAAHTHVRACIDAAAALGGVPVGTFIGRDPGRSVAENLREAERIFPPLVDYAGERGVRLMIENCVMEGWHPDGYPGNLAYSPELWEWMFELGLYLNFDPSHLLWLGIDPVAALRPYVDRVAHAHAKDAETFPADRNRYGFFGRVSTREEDPWGMGWWRYRIPGLGQVDFPHYVDALYEGGFDGILSVEHEDPGVGRQPGAGRGRPADRAPQPPRAGGRVTKVLEVRDLVKEFPGVKALQGVNFDVLEGEVHCLLGPNGAGKSTLIKCISGVHEPTSGEILFKGEPLPVGDPAASLARGVATIYQELDLVDDLTVAESIFLAHEPRRGPLLDFDQMHSDTTALLARLGHESISPRTKVRALRPAAQQIVSIARALSVRRPPAGHGRAVGDPRRGRDRDAVRRRAAAHRRRRGRGLHLPSPRRDPPHRQPRHGAGRRPHHGHRHPIDHADRGARRAHGRPQGGPALSRAARRHGRGSARRSRGQAPPGREGRQPPGARRRGPRPGRARGLGAHRAAGPDLRHRHSRGGGGLAGGQAAPVQPARGDRGRPGPRAGGPQVAGAGARLEPGEEREPGHAAPVRPPAAEHPSGAQRRPGGSCVR